MWTLEDVKTLFELSGCIEDFGINEYDDKIVCGSWNRAYLYPDGTLKVSGPHSSSKFLETADHLDIEII